MQTRPWQTKPRPFITNDKRRVFLKQPLAKPELTTDQKVQILKYLSTYTKKGDTNSVVFILKWLEINYNLILQIPKQDDIKQGAGAKYRRQMGGNPPPSPSELFDNFFQDMYNLSDVILPEEMFYSSLQKAFPGIQIKTETDIPILYNKFLTAKQELAEADKIYMDSKNVLEYKNNYRIAQSNYFDSLGNLQEEIEQLQLEETKSGEDELFDNLRQLPFYVLSLIAQKMFENDIVENLEIKDGQVVYQNLLNGNQVELKGPREIIEEYGKEQEISQNWDFNYAKNTIVGNNTSLSDIANLKSLAEKNTDISELQSQLFGELDAKFLQFFGNLHDIASDRIFLAVLQSIHMQFDHLADDANQNTNISTVLEFVHHYDHMFEFHMFRNGYTYHCSCSSKSIIFDDTENGVSMKPMQRSVRIKKNFSIFNKEGVVENNNSFEIKQSMCRYFYTNLLRDLWGYRSRNTIASLDLCKSITITFLNAPLQGGSAISRLYRKYCGDGSR